jgi:hypothetical protein
MSWGPVSIAHGSVNMSWKLVTRSWESHIVSIEPLSMSKYTFKYVSMSKKQ